VKQDVIVSAQALSAAVAAIVRGAGSDAREAELVGGNLVEANLKGHDSHGVGMIPRYVDSIKEGGLTLNAHASIAGDAGALITVNGNRGYGQVVAREAIEFGVARARQFGTCIVGLANAHHIGRIGAWAEQAAAQGLVSVHFVNVFARSIVAPWGGRDARHGTNPFCVGIPRQNDDPVILDFATSRIAQGKTRVAYNRGERLKPGVVIDDRGEPTTDPRYAVVEPAGAILPFGEHKGSGLAFICEILGGALAGGLTWHPQDGQRDGGGRRQIINGMLSILIDPARLGTSANLYTELEAFIAWFKASPPDAYVEQVQIAGEPERRTMQQRLATGIPIDANSWEEILSAAEKIGLKRTELVQIAGI
jgi:hydroxycarboxylate dehydrogenase B